MKHMTSRLTWALALLTLLGACTQAGSNVLPTTAPLPVATPEKTSSTGTISTATEAATLAEEFIAGRIAYIASEISGQADASLLQGIVSNVIPTPATALVAACFAEGVAGTTSEHFEHSAWIDHVLETENPDPIHGQLWEITYIDTQVNPGGTDLGLIRSLIVGTSGIIGGSGELGGVPACLIDSLDLIAVSVEFVSSDAVFTGFLDGSANQGSDAEGSGEEQWLRREAFAADPNNPEPISSTGSNKWDLITASDPTTFACLIYDGQGPEEILDVGKSGYEEIADAYLFTAFFTDGTTIAVRIHPEFGSVAAATAEAERYTVPLGQLPSLLRAGIGRFAVRVGNNTAVASHGEGIFMQSENTSVRIGDNRLAETLFHESVHTSLDSIYGYMRSPEWLAAQELDGQWLTEYGRNNPDNEDLAESALYAYTLLHHPERFTPEDAAIVAERIPNRIRFIGTLFPVDQSIFANPLSLPTACTTP